jgi:hypothetical protein
MMCRQKGVQYRKKAYRLSDKTQIRLMTKEGKQYLSWDPLSRATAEGKLRDQVGKIWVFSKGWEPWRHWRWVRSEAKG